MLSQKAEQFLVELRFYLISKGKKDKEIEEIIDELEIHLTEAEANGKNIDQIIGNSPKEYMKSIGQQMPIDVKELITLIPVFLLTVLAYSTLPSAISGTFALSSNHLIFGSIASIIVLIINGIFFFKWMPKLFQSTWLVVTIYFLTFSLTTGIFVAFHFWNGKHEASTIFVATPMQNTIILIICIIVVIGCSLYFKSWITFLVAVYISLEPILRQVLPPHINENTTYMIYAAIISVVVVGVALFFLFKKKKTA